MEQKQSDQKFLTHWWPEIDEGSNGEEKNRKPTNQDIKTKKTCARRSRYHGSARKEDLWAWFRDLEFKKKN